MPNERSDRLDALPTGCVLRDYTIQDVLGHGGFGIVYRARHNELDHAVAIKEYLPSEFAVRDGTTVRAKSADCETYFADGLRRFREEAKALIEFQQHSSIVDCRDFFRANDTAYLVMEYVDGSPLSDLLRHRESAGQPFTESDLLAIAIPLAQGLAHIHRAGVIHRDVKPANILVRRTDQQPVLIDFGAAKQVVAEHSRSLAPYTEGYAALEQVADGRLGPWTDMYGYGAVLWRMVAGGNRPWEPPNPVKVESRASARLQGADDPLPMASELGAGRFAEPLLDMIDECLQLKGSDRPGESDSVVRRLRADGWASQQSAGTASPVAGHADKDRRLSAHDEARDSSSSKRSLRTKLRVAVAITVAVAFAVVFQLPRNETLPSAEGWGFTIDAEPATAVVTLLNGPEPYRRGMLLIPGQYEVEVRAPGFTSLRESITHSESETWRRVILQPLPNSEPVLVPTPSDPPKEGVDSTGGKTEQAPSELSNESEPVAIDPDVPADQHGSNTEDGPQSVCGGGDWAECFELGEAYRTGDGVPRDAARAAQFYEIACNGGIARSCFNLAISYAKGDGVRQDPSREVEFYERACDGGDARGCSNLGILYEKGELVSRDRSLSAEFMERACDHGLAASCYSLALGYFIGERVPLDYGRAAEFFQRACDGGEAGGCWNLGNMHQFGDGVDVDFERAAELYRQACDGGDPEGCSSLGYLYEHAQGVAEDWGRAAELYRRACSGEYPAGCNNLGLLYSRGKGVDVDIERAAEFFEQACDDREPNGCYNLAVMYHNGQGLPLNRERAAELYKQACDGGAIAGCSNLGLLYQHGHGVTLDPARAAELFRQACAAGLVVGCFNLGNSYFEGRGVPKDQERALELFRQACDGDDMRGCYNLALTYYSRDEAGQSRSVIVSLLEKACSNGFEQACETLETLD